MVSITKVTNSLISSNGYLIDVHNSKEIMYFISLTLFMTIMVYVGVNVTKQLLLSNCY